MSAPAAMNASSSRSGIVSTVGPLSRLKPCDRIIAGASARDGLALDDRDLVAGLAQVCSSGQPTETGADDDDVHGFVRSRNVRRCLAPMNMRHQTLRLTYSASCTSSVLATSVIGASSSDVTADSVSAAMCASSSSSAPVSTITCLDAGDRVGRHVGVADEFEHRELLRRRPAGRPCQQRRRLALDEVAADGLAGDRLVAEGTHHVVAHLEGVAERQAVVAEVREQLVGALGCGEDGAEVERPLDRVLARLVAADPLRCRRPRGCG